MEVKVRGSRRLGEHCYEIGSQLITTHEPFAETFVGALQPAAAI